MCCSVPRSWLGDGCKGTDNMTFSLTNDGQEGHYYEQLAELSAGPTLWLYMDADIFSDFKADDSKDLMLEFFFFFFFLSCTPKEGNLCL